MAKVKIMALGGLDELHKNMYVLEIDAKIFIIDAGIYEPLSANFGIQHFIPDVTYIKEFSDRVKGIFLTSGKRMENAALPELVKILPKVNIYGSAPTIKTLELFFDSSKWNMNVVDNLSPIDFGDVKVKGINSAGSIPGTFSWAFETVDGTILYSINSLAKDIENNKVLLNDFSSIKNTLLLMYDSSNMMKPNNTHDLLSIKEQCSTFIGNKRTVVLVYEDEVNTISELIEIAVEKKQEIYFTDKNMKLLIKNFMDEGYITKATISDDENNKNQLVFLTSTRTHLFKNAINVINSSLESLLTVKDDDKIIVASTAQIGNEHVYAKLVSEISKRDIEYIDFKHTEKERYHPTPYDLEKMIKILSPKNLMPIKSYYKEMIRVIKPSVKAGIPAENIVIADNGDQVFFKNGRLDGVVEKYNKVGQSIIEDATSGDIDERVIKERESLAANGLVSIAMLIKKDTKELCSEIDLQMKGVVFMRSQEKMIDTIKSNITDILKDNANDFKINRVISLVKKMSEKEIKRNISKSPQLIIEIHEN